MKAFAAPWKPARVAADCPGALDSGVTGGRLGSLSGGAAIVQVVTNPLQSAWQGRSRREDEIAHLLKQRSLQSIGLLIKWMVWRRVRTIETSAIAPHPPYRPQWIQATMTQECSELVSELADGMPDWRIAAWFDSPNPRLFDLTPADLLPCDWGVVIDTARLDMLDATGGSNLGSTEAARRAPSGGCGESIDRKQTQGVGRKGW